MGFVGVWTFGEKAYGLSIRSVCERRVVTAKVTDGPEVRGRDGICTRREFVVWTVAALLGGAVAGGETKAVKADGWEGVAGGYGGLDDLGAKAPVGEASLSYKDFLKAIEAKKIDRVDFYGPNGDQAYASMSGKVIRVGEGFPEERSKGWSSPLWVARTLSNYNIPYKFHFLDGAKFKTMKDIGYANGCTGNVFACLPSTSSSSK